MLTGIRTITRGTDNCIDFCRIQLLKAVVVEASIWIREIRQNLGKIHMTMTGTFPMCSEIWHTFSNSSSELSGLSGGCCCPLISNEWSTIYKDKATNSDWHELRNYSISNGNSLFNNYILDKSIDGINDRGTKHRHHLLPPSQTFRASNFVFCVDGVASLAVKEKRRNDGIHVTLYISFSLPSVVETSRFGRRTVQWCSSKGWKKEYLGVFSRRKRRRSLRCRTPDFW